MEEIRQALCDVHPIRNFIRFLAAKICKPTLRIENTQKLTPEIHLLKILRPKEI